MLKLECQLGIVHLRGEERLAGLVAGQLAEDRVQGLHLGHAHLPGARVQERDAVRAGAAAEGHEPGGLVGLDAVRGEAGGEHAGDVALDDALGEARVLAYPPMAIFRPISSRRRM